MPSTVRFGSCRRHDESSGDDRFDVHPASRPVKYPDLAGGLPSSSQSFALRLEHGGERVVDAHLDLNRPHVSLGSHHEVELRHRRVEVLYWCLEVIPEALAAPMVVALWAQLL